MRTDFPTEELIPDLRGLWKEAFGDTDSFLDLFFATGFSSRRCRCVTEDGALLAALYWFDLPCDSQRFAYIYAVATSAAARGRGLCRHLMADTAAVLEYQGYHGAILVPQDEGLRAMYGKMGYLSATGLDESLCIAGFAPADIQEITPTQYAARRAPLLSLGSMGLEGASLSFLGTLARFYEAPGLLAAVSREPEHLRILEFLGDKNAAPGLVAALGHGEATLRMPGSSTPFAMYLPLTPDCRKPEYFAFCFD